MNLMPLASALCGMAVVMCLAPLALQVCARRKWLVRATDLHHTHQGHIPRLGGLLLVVAFLVLELVIALAWPEKRAATAGRNVVVLGSLAMFALGFWDDIRPLGARNKLIGQILIAGCVYGLGVSITQFKIPFTGEIIDLNAWGAVLTILWLVGLTNLVNLIDGADGLAGGICLMLMLLLAFVGHQHGNFELLAAGMAGALLGFLWFNFPPARLYLGDGGAYFLGFQIGLFSIVNSHKGTVIAALVAPLFVLALPIVDTGLAILRRGLRGLPVWRPDRQHIHHRLIQMGFSRRKTVVSLYAVTLIFLGMGFLAYWSRGGLVPLLLGASVVLMLYLAGKLKFSREWFSIGRVMGNSLGMRRQVQYALSLMRWLELEGTRQPSLELLWSDFVFAAQKLGFHSVKLSLEDGARNWQLGALTPDSLSISYILKGGRLGVLEVSASPCSAPDAAPNHPGAQPPACDGRVCPCVCNPQVFEIISELLAESWTRAATAWTREFQTVLRFNGRTAAEAASRRKPWLAPLPLADGVSRDA
jgi:UDP-GlcNAc:undecaprenyl-phosphate GlcNAc-1-phosphate transferase